MTAAGLARHILGSTPKERARQHGNAENVRRVEF